ncbi:MAG: acyl-CoA dehydrogenase family protein [Actinomycetota bacterium]|nr:acyl-CoA dehydrogenase family protein [Actinomycetota bacterium]
MKDVLGVLKRWLSKDVEPNVLALEHSDTYPSEIVEQMASFGLFGATIPAEYGGLGLTATAYSRVVTLIAETWMSLTGVLNSHLMMAHLVERFGTQTQRVEFLPRLASGTLRGGLALTEPDCGTDLQAIRTVAMRTPDGAYRITGRKMWITNARYGNCLALLVKTNPTAQPRHAGMSMFLVEKEIDGYLAGPKLGKLGYRGVDTVEVEFNDVEVPSSRLLGEREGHGFHHALGGLELGRINVAARGCGVANAALKAALQYSKVRHTMGRPIGDHQAIALKLADMGCRARAAELLTREAAGAFDAGRRCDLEAGMAKLAATEAALSNATEAMRVHGAYGYSTEAHVERYFRDAPLLCIGEGTNEIQRVVIAKRLLAEVGQR